MFRSIKKSYWLAVIVVVYFLFHLHVFNKELTGIHVWRQTQTQTTIENFIHKDQNILMPRVNNLGICKKEDIYRMEFPFMQWGIAFIASISPGRSLMISRILSFVIAVFSIFAIYLLINTLTTDSLIALFTAWAFAFSPLIYYYCINPMPDNLSLCLSLWSQYFFIRWFANNRSLFFVLASFILLLAVLCKLPFIVFAALPMAIVLFAKNTISFKTKYFLILIFSLLPAFLWYMWVIPDWEGNGVVNGITQLTQGNYLYVFDIIQHNLISTFPEILLNYLSLPFFIIGFVLLFKFRKKYSPSLLWGYLFTSILLVAYFFYELNMIEKVHDYYLMPFMPIIFIIVGAGIKYATHFGPVFKKISFILLLLLPLTAWIRVGHWWSERKTGFNPDILKYKYELQALIPSDALCVAGNDASPHIYLYHLNRKGWTYHYDLAAAMLADRVNKGAKYLINDDPVIDAEVLSLTDSVLFKKGTVTVYSLKNLKEQ